MAGSHNRRRITLGVVTLAATVFLAACSDDGDQVDAGSDATTSIVDQTTSSSVETTQDTSPPTTASSSSSTTGVTTTAVPGPSEQAMDNIADLLAVVFPSAPYETEPGPAGAVAYFGFNEAGDRRETPSALLAQNAGEAASDGVLITNLNAGAAVTSPFEVAGRGRGFEATLDVRAVTPEGVVIASTFTMGGPFETLEPFSVTIDSGAHDGPLYVVVSSSTGLEIDLPNFAIVLLNVTPAPSGPPESAAVVRVTADDILNVRSGPGATFSVVAELAPDATGVSVTSRPGGLTGWWTVVTPDGVAGWASSAFLVLEKPFGPSEQAALLSLADDFSAALVPFQEGSVAALPWSTRFGTVAMGWPGDPLEEVSSSSLRNGTSDVWTVARTWPISGSFSPPFEEVNFVEFARPLAVGHANRQVVIDRALTYPFLDTPVVRNTHHVAIVDLGADIISWRVVRLHVDFTTGSPEIMAVTIEHWDP